MSEHRCRVNRYAGNMGAYWLVACLDLTCGFHRSADDWYLAMGEARAHWGLFNEPRRTNGLAELGFVSEVTPDGTIAYPRRTPR